MWPSSPVALTDRDAGDVDDPSSVPARVVLVGLCDLALRGMEAVLSGYGRSAVVVDAGPYEAVDVDLVLHAGERLRSLDAWRSHHPGARFVACRWGGDLDDHHEDGSWLNLCLPSADLVARLLALRASASPLASAVGPAEPPRVGGAGAREGGDLVGKAGLGPREAQVLALIGQGLSNAEITALMHVSINTVKTYIRTSYRKIGVSSRTRAALWVVAHRTGPTGELPTA